MRLKLVYVEGDIMKTFINTKLFLISLFFLLLGGLSLVMENIFYEYIEWNGVLQESFYLPFGVFCILLGLIAMIINIFRLYFVWNGTKKER